jgi:hypothetical protein
MTTRRNASAKAPTTAIMISESSRVWCTASQVERSRNQLSRSTYFCVCEKPS